MAIKNYNELNSMELDTLREVGSIGTGNAATALSWNPGVQPADRDGKFHAGGGRKYHDLLLYQRVERLGRVGR